MSNKDETQAITVPRSSVLSEKSTVTIGLAIIIVGFAFWMGVQHSLMNSLDTNFRKILEDHEARIRVLEQKKP